MYHFAVSYVLIHRVWGSGMAVALSRCSLPCRVCASRGRWRSSVRRRASVAGFRRHRRAESVVRRRRWQRGRPAGGWTWSRTARRGVAECCTSPSRGRSTHRPRHRTAGRRVPRPRGTGQEQRTHTRLTALLSGTTRVSRYHKGKTSLDFTEARDSEWQWHQLGIISKSAPRTRQITMTAPRHSVFYRPDALPAAQPTASKHCRH